MDKNCFNLNIFMRMCKLFLKDSVNVFEINKKCNNNFIVGS